MTGPKVLFIDIETSPNSNDFVVQRPPYAGAVYVLRDTYILMASWKWGHERHVKTAALPDYPRYKRNRHDDSALCGTLRDLLDAADIVVAHNGDAFDIKKINSRLITNGFKPPSPFKTIDTLKAARRAFKFDSNKLDNIGRYLNEGRKIPNTGAACGAGASRMATRSRGVSCGDTASRTRNCLRGFTSGSSRGWPTTLIWGCTGRQRRPPGIACPTCESTNTQRRGITVRLKTRCHRHQCRECGSWFLGKKV
jgi:hypothetical protein